jgi:hypothetical protein
MNATSSLLYIRVDLTIEGAKNENTAQRVTVLEV